MCLQYTENRLCVELILIKQMTGTRATSVVQVSSVITVISVMSLSSVINVMSLINVISSIDWTDSLVRVMHVTNANCVLSVNGLMCFHVL